MQRIEIEVLLKNLNAKSKEEKYISFKEVYIMDDIKNLSKCVKKRHSHNGGKEYIGYAIKDIKDCDFKLENCCLYLDSKQELTVETFKNDGGKLICI